jgi:basic membrane lipoprotein Med (substrate-binding protein (PBP1-ABC) superfamily)
VTLHLESRAEAERLDELHLRAFEIRVDAELALGRHGELVGELRQLVEETRYRERLVAQLMVALYRSGRQVEALEVYERTRRDLEHDLGLRPGEELQRLAGQIVRQEPQLRTPAPSVPIGDVQRTRLLRARRLSPIVLAGALAVAATAIAIGLGLTDAGLPGSGGSTRVALIRMWDPGSLSDEAGSSPFVDGLLEAERTHELETEIVDLFPRRPPSGGFEQGSQEDVDRLSARLRSGEFDLVLWPLGLPGPRFYDVVPQYPDTRFVFLDYCCAKGVELGGAPNATALTLRAGQAAHLAGYLSGLMEARRTLPRGRRHVVSIISGEPNFPPQQALVQGFSTGARRALPDVEVRSDYSFEYDDQAACERIANQQIDAGSGVVFATAGDCALGALSAAAIRGVWGVASSEDRSHLGSHILASASQHYDRLVELTVSWYLEGRLPPAGDVELGLVDGAVALAGINPDVPPLVRAKVAQEAARLRAQEGRKIPD